MTLDRQRPHILSSPPALSDPFLNLRPPVERARLGRRTQRRRGIRHCFNSVRHFVWIVVTGFSGPIPPLLRRYLALGQWRRLQDPPMVNDVVRSALQSPVTNRRPERYRLPIKGQLPVGRAQGRHDLLAAATAAAVRDRAVLHRNIKYPRLKEVGSVLDKAVL